MSEIFKDGQAYLRVGENHKVRLPSEFIKFWNIKVGDELMIFKGKETVMLVPSNYKPTKKKHFRGKVTVSDHLVSMIDKAGQPLPHSELQIPNRSETTIRGRLSELVSQGVLKRIESNGVVYFGRK
jgi:bifunctional DNA-binding transcriptional regulator/antitoxin component of YhaV-PrlF toxin-antitoxin module